MNEAEAAWLLGMLARQSLRSERLTRAAIGALFVLRDQLERHEPLPDLVVREAVRTLEEALDREEQR